MSVEDQDLDELAQNEIKFDSDILNQFEQVMHIDQKLKEYQKME